tara:strand:+ start:553 stop:780 length:228 start_codon:yes stop_codon:yes gene_type:complete
MNHAIDRTMENMGISTYSQLREKVRYNSNGRGTKGLNESYKDLIIELVQKSIEQNTIRKSCDCSYHKKRRLEQKK